MDGMSAYESWLMQGNIGTEDEFIESLKVKGDQGPRGPQGPKGNDGKDGFLGSETGYETDIGRIMGFAIGGTVKAEVNAVVESGILNGRDGRDGIDGISVKGDKGDPGQDGKDGVDGKDGQSIKGDKGDRGQDGRDGAQGPKGEDGLDGKSAYQLWLDEGFTGTENDFFEYLVRNGWERYGTLVVSGISGGGGLKSLAGLIQAGENVSIAGSGTRGDPYIISSTGGGGGGIYNGTSPTTITVGLLPQGTDIVGVSHEDLFEMMLAGYVTPTFSSFTMSGQSTAVEVGTTVSGNKTFAWSFTNSGNVAPNTMDILDVTNAVTLATDISITSPSPPTDIGSIALTSPGAYSWRGRADNTQGGTLNSALFTVNWQWRRYSGTSSNLTLTETQIEGLATSALASGFAGTYTFAAGDFKYFAWPDSFGSPTATTGFKDSATNLSISMATAADNAAYSNVQNGWSYALVSVTNANGATTNYRLYRTKNLLGGTLTALVS